jgi:rod shape-determining protein MreD
MSYSGDRILLGSQRESRVSSFRPWVLFVIPLLAVLFNFYIPQFFRFLGFLDLPLLVTVYFAVMKRSQIAGTFIGAFIGLAQDSLSKNPLGHYGIVNTLVGYFAASIGLRVDVDHPFIRLLLGFFSFFVHEFFAWVLARALLGQQVDFNLESTLVLGFLNAVVALFLFHFLDRLRETS